MKIKVGNKVYLQKYDVEFLISGMSEIKASIVNEIFRGDVPFIMCGDYYVFSYVFEDPENVKWLMSQEWIVDYEKYFKKPISELKSIHGKLKNKYSNEVDDFNSKTDLYREKFWPKYDKKFKQMEHELVSFSSLIKYLNGKVDFDFPYKELGGFRCKKRLNFLSRLFGRGAR